MDIKPVQRREKSRKIRTLDNGELSNHAGKYGDRQTTGRGLKNKKHGDRGGYGGEDSDDESDSEDEMYGRRTDKARPKKKSKSAGKQNNSNKFKKNKGAVGMKNVSGTDTFKKLDHRKRSELLDEEDSILKSGKKATKAHAQGKIQVQKAGSLYTGKAARIGSFATRDSSQKKRINGTKGVMGMRLDDDDLDSDNKKHSFSEWWSKITKNKKGDKATQREAIRKEKKRKMDLKEKQREKQNKKLKKQGEDDDKKNASKKKNQTRTQKQALKNKHLDS
jgi:hypothetical protein